MDGPSKDLNQDQVSLAIASVLEAIMENQQDPQHLGGFALATTYTLRDARRPMSGEYEIANRVIRPRRVWLMPYYLPREELLQITEGNLPESVQDHTLLAILQEERNMGKSHFCIYLVDSKPAILRKHGHKVSNGIKRIASRLGWNTDRNGDHHIVFHGDYDENEVCRKVVTQGGHAALHTVLNAWIAALGLTYVEDGIRDLAESSYTAAYHLIRLALSGYIDWSTITAFLVCQKLVQETVIDAVPLDRRFKRTREQIGVEDLAGRLANLAEDDLVLRRDRPDDTLFPYDLRNNVEFGRKVFEHDEGGQSRLDMKDFKEDYDDWCHYVKRALAHASRAPGADTFLADLRSRDELDIAQEYGSFLSQEEVVHGIASVTMAINRTQSWRGGFSVASLWGVQLPDEYFVDVRSGRPLLFPLSYQNHTVLVVIQLDDLGEPTISIVDSMPWHYDLEDRNAVFNMARRVANHWGRLVVPESHEYLTASYIHGPRQRNDWFCGYYALYAGWALAMGLELNTEFRPKNVKEFYVLSKDLMHLARGGFVDWKVIYAFLRCQGFVTDQRVPPSRRFDQTLRVQDDDELRYTIEGHHQEETAYWEWAMQRDEARGEHDYDDIGNYTRVQLPPSSHLHNDSVPSDDYNEYVRNDIIRHLDNEGLLDLDMTGQELIDRFNWERAGSTKTVDDILIGFESHLRDTFEDYEKWDLQDLFDEFRGYIDSLEDRIPEVNQARFVLDPCDFYRRRYRMLTRLWSELPAIKIPPNVAKIDLGFQASEKESITAPLSMLDDDEVGMAIASVVGAIDDLQSSSGATPSVTGFSLASNTITAPALMWDDPAPFVPGRMFTTRPRRCWLLPVFVTQGDLGTKLEEYRQKLEHADGKKRGRIRDHTFLVVIQEELISLEDGTSSTEFRVYFLDSAPHHLAEYRDFIYNRIQKMARTLGWSTHRNPSDSIRFSDRFWEVEVVRQGSRVACGYHVILLAWILAMGLTPNPNAVFDDSLYMSIRQVIVSLAYKGLLDWKTLTAWLVCKGMIMERSLDDVPKNRQFAHTLLQTNTEDLRGQLLNIVWKHDDVLRKKLEADVPYDRSNNVDFDDMDIKERNYREEELEEAVEEETQEDQEQGEIEDFDAEPGHLARSYEVDDWDWFSEDDEMLDWRPLRSGRALFI
ncbi:hypothetical protein BDV96DRAFT_563543 [Lophiotrema nucula]|uniref:Ubiquitin-like protease family profile domain-containing protein n=1 Tax=Lophiotrema nucula TaxID=690887 RepID=A0A6A5ZS64_9PLEO|nr:hypothetical protein BDV96DRAFT_563543 [Lophiotrema nucula]